LGEQIDFSKGIVVGAKTLLISLRLANCRQGKLMSSRDKGTKVYGAQVCPNCGEASSANAKYCAHCGCVLSVPFSSKQIRKPQKIAKRSTLNAKEVISKAFYFGLGIGWVLFSIFVSIWVYSILISFGLIALVISLLSFLHLFAPIVILGNLVRKENYGAIVFACWLVLSLFNATSIFSLSSDLGIYASLAMTVFAWIIIVLTYAFINNMIFSFPSLPKILEKLKSSVSH
jgi:ribosomal protein L32